MTTTSTIDAKSAAKEVIDGLPDNATWDEVMYRMYVRQAIETGLREAAEGKDLVDTAEVRKKYGLPE